MKAGREEGKKVHRGTRWECGWIWGDGGTVGERAQRRKMLKTHWCVEMNRCSTRMEEEYSCTAGVHFQAANSFYLVHFSPLSEALGTVNPTDYSAPLLLDWTFTISRGRQQWGPDESNIHGISFTLLPLSHAPPPLCQAPVWWEELLTLAAPIDRQFCKDGPQQLRLSPLLPLYAPKQHRSIMHPCGLMFGRIYFCSPSVFMVSRNLRCHERFNEPGIIIFA